MIASKISKKTLMLFFSARQYYDTTIRNHALQRIQLDLHDYFHKTEQNSRILLGMGDTRIIYSNNYHFCIKCEKTTVSTFVIFLCMFVV